MKKITRQQQKYIYAIFKDISEWCGYYPSEVKRIMKIEFEHGDFSLSNCDSQLTGEFIDFLLEFCVENGVIPEESKYSIVRCDDIEKYLYYCLKHKKCAVCGLDGEVHHWQAIGMGRDRTSIDDSELTKICLCRVHHTECHVDQVKFAKKWHVKGIKYTKETPN